MEITAPTQASGTTTPIRKSLLLLFFRKEDLACFVFLP
jgi:hypothetical protein